MKTILKNTEKYSNIKLAKGLLLDDSKTIKRAGECGVSTGIVSFTSLNKGSSFLGSSITFGNSVFSFSFLSESFLPKKRITKNKTIKTPINTHK